MKLFYSPGACSLSPHIALLEAGLKFSLEKVDLRSKKAESGEDFNDVNGKGYVPALQLDNDQVLTEGAAIVQYIADQNPNAMLAPPAGTMEHYKLQEWLSFIVADGYLFTVLGWAPLVGFDLSNWPIIQQYIARVGSRPKVIAAMKSEGLI